MHYRLTRLFASQSAALLVDELESLSTLADTFAASRTSDDEGPQSQAPQVVALHLKGMNVRRTSCNNMVELVR